MLKLLGHHDELIAIFLNHDARPVDLDLLDTFVVEVGLGRSPANSLTVDSEQGLLICWELAEQTYPQILLGTYGSAEHGEDRGVAHRWGGDWIKELLMELVEQEIANSHHEFGGEGGSRSAALLCSELDTSGEGVESAIFDYVELGG